MPRVPFRLRGLVIQCVAYVFQMCNADSILAMFCLLTILCRARKTHSTHTLTKPTNYMQLNRLEWINGIAERGALNSLGKWPGFDFDGRTLCLSVFNYGHSVGPWEIEDAFACQRVDCRQGAPFDSGGNVLNTTMKISNSSQFEPFCCASNCSERQGETKFRVQQAALSTPYTRIRFITMQQSQFRITFQSRARARLLCNTHKNAFSFN